MLFLRWEKSIECAVTLDTMFENHSWRGIAHSKKGLASDGCFLLLLDFEVGIIDPLQFNFLES